VNVVVELALGFVVLGAYPMTPDLMLVVDHFRVVAFSVVATNAKTKFETPKTRL
jgi:hypothetical protein